MKNTSLEALKAHLFETLEGVKNLSDPKASKNEKIQLDQAKAIVEVSDTIIDIYKVQLDAAKFVEKAENLKTRQNLLAIGIEEV